jgi:hypothetical protein
MHTATPQIVWSKVKSKIGELHIMLKNCKTSREEVAQSVDYAAIYDERREAKEDKATTTLQLETLV